ESKVLAINPDSLQSIEIAGQEGLKFKLGKRDNSWIDQNGTELNPDKVMRFISKLEDIKSYSILEKLNSDQQSFLERTIQLPSISLKIITSQGVRNYYMNEIKGQIPGMNVVKNNSFIL